MAVNLSERGEYVWNLSDFEWQKCDTWIKFQEGQNMINLTKLPRESFDSWTVWRKKDIQKFEYCECKNHKINNVTFGHFGQSSD